tara:strand:+ start:775 stop:1839 length:1065 start_codon:yes stop_codon:yes gene_type:complete
MKYKTDLKKIIISKDATINQSLDLLDKTGKGCLLIVNKNGILIGTITDGDIRRQLLEGKSINNKINGIYNEHPKHILEKFFTKEKALKIILESKINLLPIINDTGLLVNYLTIDDVLTEKKKNVGKINLPVIIMAGGKGSRLKPFTNVLPKPLLPINKKTIFEHIVHQFEKIGCEEFYLTLNYRSNLMKAYIDDLSPGYKVYYAEEKKPLGTAGGLKLLNEKFSEPIFVTNCDIIIKTDYYKFLKFHEKGKFDLSLIAAAKNYKIPYGTCEIDTNGLLTSINEKPIYNFLTNTGLYILNPYVLEYIPEDTFFHITHLISALIKDGKKVGVYPVSDDSWLDVGQWKDYQINKDSI